MPRNALRIGPRQHHRRVPAPALELYSKVLRQAVERLPDLETIPETGPDLDKYVEAMGECFQDAIQAAGKVCRPVGRAAHWWTPECTEAYRNWKRTGVHHDGLEKKEVQRVTRAARRAY
jgi:hypothetical protein